MNLRMSGRSGVIIVCALAVWAQRWGGCDSATEDGIRAPTRHEFVKWSSRRTGPASKVAAAELSNSASEFLPILNTPPTVASTLRRRVTATRGGVSGGAGSDASLDDGLDRRAHDGHAEQRPERRHLHDERPLWTGGHVPRSPHKRAFEARADAVEADEHFDSMSIRAACGRPRERVVCVQDLYPDADVVYRPACTILHRCDRAAGCCSRPGELCRPHTSERVALRFHVGERPPAPPSPPLPPPSLTQPTDVAAGGAETAADAAAFASATAVVRLTFTNHTACSCGRPHGLAAEAATVATDAAHENRSNDRARHRPLAVSGDHRGGARRTAPHRVGRPPRGRHHYRQYNSGRRDAAYPIYTGHDNDLNDGNAVGDDDDNDRREGGDDVRSSSSSSDDDDSVVVGEDYNDDGNEELPWLDECGRCPRPFVRRAVAAGCVCDCFDGDLACVDVKRGQARLDDVQRRCVRQRACEPPTCAGGLHYDSGFGECRPRRRTSPVRGAHVERRYDGDHDDHDNDHDDDEDGDDGVNGDDNDNDRTNNYEDNAGDNNDANMVDGNRKADDNMVTWSRPPAAASNGGFVAD